MTRSDALQVIEMYRNWNEGQTSVSLAFNGVRTPEDDLLDERRKLIREAYRTLREVSQ